MSVAAKRRDTEVFSMAFLDCICCGFGAVILIFILTVAVKTKVDQSEIDTTASKVEKAAKDVTMSQADVDRLIQALAASQIEVEKLDAENTQEQLRLTTREKEMALVMQQTGALRNALNNLLGQKKEIPTEDVPRIPIPNIERRQYLTGIDLGSGAGKKILFLVRSSGSMLDESVEAAAARLGDTDEQKRLAPKWQRTVMSLEWLLAMLEPKTRFQVYFFNEDVIPVIAGKFDGWYTTEDKPVISEVVKAIEKIVPRGSANLERAFTTIRRMTEQPDSIIMITDGLPTSSDSWLSRGGTSELDRQRFFDLARQQLSSGRRIPVSTIMMPLTGDPSAPFIYWRLAYQTKGSFVSPAKDWPSL